MNGMTSTLYPVPCCVLQFANDTTKKIDVGYESND